MLRYPSLTLFLVGWLCWLGTADWSGAHPTSQDIQLFIGDKKTEVDARQQGGRLYYQLKDIVAIFSLSFTEKENQLSLFGPRGALELVDGRSLVKFEDEYILLATPPWQRKKRDWYVPEDFFTKSLPLILKQNLEKLGDGRYRVHALEENRVYVKVDNYLDHVKIVFVSSKKAPVRVREFQDYIEVKFEEYLIKPELSSTQPDPRLVSALEFNSKDVFGAFQVYKGKDYYNFRQYNRSDPERKEVHVYAPPAVPSSPLVIKEPALPDSSAAGWLSQPARTASAERSAPVFDTQIENVVTIDPGHGGENYGVGSSEEVWEKNLTLEIAKRIGQRLQGEAYQGILTRHRDVNLPVEHRSAIGNRYRSKIYISVHAGGSYSPTCQGSVVYVHRYMDSTEPQEEDGGSDARPRLDVMDTVSEAPSVGQNRQLTLWQEGQRTHLPGSRKLAELIQEQLNKLYRIKNQVVEIPLAVLAPVTAPAVLVEIGFLTNSEDREKLGSSSFQDELAAAVVRAVLSFLR